MIVTFIRKSFMAFGICFIFLHPSVASYLAKISDSSEYSDEIITTFQDTLYKAVLLGDADLVKKLIQEGANPNVLDSRGWTPLDYAKKRSRPDLEQILKDNGARTFPKKIPVMVEGPHIRLLDSQKVEVLVLRHEINPDKSSISEKKYQINQFPAMIDGIMIEPEDLEMRLKSPPSATLFSDIGKVFVIGDIHGEYNRVVGLLKDNRIIDKNGRWSWGNGHLVFMGDIFDRGTRVTETLWLIFSLEKQAEKAGGKVHLLLGNHEPMIFDNDIRYITDDYYSLCENLGKSYCGLFDEKSVLGYWLRQKPVMLQINNFVFLHGGISPELGQMEIKIDTINKYVWQHLNNVEPEKDVLMRKMIMGNKGVLWYRGLASIGSEKDETVVTGLNKALEFYKASIFIIGHSEVDSISTFFGRKVIDVNIPKRDEKIKEQGLLIIGGKIWVSYDYKTKKALLE